MFFIYIFFGFWPKRFSFEDKVFSKFSRWNFLFEELFFVEFPWDIKRRKIGSGFCRFHEVGFWYNDLF